MDQNPWVQVEQIANGVLDFIGILIIVAVILFVVGTIFAIYYINSPRHDNATNNFRETINKTKWCRNLKACFIKLFRKMEHANLRFDAEEKNKAKATVDESYAHRTVVDNLSSKKEKEEKEEKSSGKKKHMKKIPFEKTWSIANNVGE